jgi:predicted ATPase/DNA-binding winged helix-turn-helix (wHTH) protein
LSTAHGDGRGFGRFRIEPAQRLLLVDGVPAPLGARAFDLLLALLERRERVVSKNELLDLVWPNLVVEENNLQVQMSTLRKLLGAQAIATVPGRGYRFVAAVDGDAGVEAAAASSTASAAAPAPAPAMATGNLPLQWSPLVGREAELQALCAALESHPLVTLVGTGGIGKTTLALAAATALREQWRDGAWLVELAPLADPAALPQAVAQVLRITLGGAGVAHEQLAGVLGSHQMLLVLDNCEHLLEAAGRLAAALATRAPGVRLLATSQERLKVRGEQVLELPPLAVPAAGEAAHAGRHGAVRLFAERAAAADPRFALDAANAEAVAEICRRLDGLPLALELAAARVRLLGVAGVRDRLGERFRVLTGGTRTAMPRQQTLHATLDWSHALLAPPEQAVLRRLGVFVGGFSLEIAQQVAADDVLDEWAVLDALGALVDKSLVAVDGGEPLRYRLLETTRAYALEQLAAQGEAAATRQRHAHALCALFVQTEEARFGEQGTLSLADFMQRLEPELDNLRAALDWALGAGGDTATAVALAGAAAELFRRVGLSQEGLRAMRALRPRIDATLAADRAALFWLRLGALGNNGRLPKAELLDAEARAQQAYRALGAARRLFASLYLGGWTLNMAGDAAGATAVLQEMGALEDPAWPAWLRCERLNLQAAICNVERRFDDAVAVAQAQLALLDGVPGEQQLRATARANLCRDLVCLGRDEQALALALAIVDEYRGDREASIGYVHRHLMTAQLCLGQTAQAEATMRQALPGWRRDGLLLYCGDVLALLHAAQGRWADAVRLGAVAESFMQRSGVSRHPVLERACERTQQLLARANLAADDVARWRREGQALDEARIAALCLGERAGG